MCWLRSKKISPNQKRLALTRSVRLLVPVALLLLYACAPPDRGVSELFAVDSLLHAQASQLTEAKASLTKHTVLGNSQEDVTITPRDTTAWLKELEVFGVMNVINKPINRDRYQTKDSADSKSNLRIRSFRTSQDLPVGYVHVYYHGRPERIRKIEAAYTELNGLYKTSRLLALEFDEIDGISVITSYSIMGGQKMFLDDTVQYNIQGRIRLEN